MTDYLKYWQTEQPVFLRPALAADVFFSPELKTSAERLLIFCRQPQTLNLITGVAGTGKSTLLKWVHGTLPVASHDMLLSTMVEAQTKPGWLTPRLAAYLGLKKRPGDDTVGVREVSSGLDELVAEKRTLLVAIDAAQLASTGDAWREVAGFLSLQALAGPCLSFLLCGDQHLPEVLTALPELTAHTTFHLELNAFSASDTAAYLLHRLQRANLSVPFEPEALQLIQDYSGGLPAKINAIGEHCLMEAAFRASRQITAELVVAALRYVGGKAPSSYTANVSHAPLVTALTSIYKPEEAPSHLVAVPSASAPYLVSALPHATPAEPAGSAPHEPAAPAPEDAAGIKLASLFKSEPGRRRP